MVTCYLKYVIDPDKVSEFEEYAQRWILLVNNYGGDHHGYYLPHEGPNNIAYALFSFASLAKYEEYREKIKLDEDCIAAFKYAQDTKCILSYERSFMRPVLGK